MAVDRGAFIDHSQSLNIFIARPNYGNITSMHFYGWQKVCKTFLCMKLLFFFKIKNVSYILTFFEILNSYRA